jgi:hypothetical protein
MSRVFTSTLSLLSLSALLSACGGGGGGAGGAIGWSPDADGTVTLQFAAYAGNSPIQCGSAVSGLGSSVRSAQIQDLRFMSRMCS